MFAHTKEKYCKSATMGEKSLLLVLVITLLVAGLAIQGAEARIAALVYDVMPCGTSSAMGDANCSAVFPNASVQLVVGSDDKSIPGTRTTTNSEGQFLMALNVTSSDMMASLASNSKVVMPVVTTPLAAAYDAFLSAAAAAGRALSARVMLLNLRVLTNNNNSAAAAAVADNQLLRDAIDNVLARGEAGGGALSVGRLAGGAVAAAGAIFDLGRFPQASYGANGALDGFGVFGVGPVSYSAAAGN